MAWLFFLYLFVCLLPRNCKIIVFANEDIKKKLIKKRGGGGEGEEKRKNEVLRSEVVNSNLNIPAGCCFASEMHNRVCYDPSKLSECTEEKD